MKRLPLLIAFACFLLAASLSAAGQATLFQVATLDNLLAGQYDGQTTLAELLENGDFGIGTFHQLDGELILLDSRVYQVRADGKVREITDRQERVPFALVTRMSASSQVKDVKIEASMTYPELQAFLDPLRSQVHPTWFKIHGRFAYLKTRSVPRQEKPYPMLAEVIARQPVFEYKNVEGTLVGLWSPLGLKPFAGSGYHFHFISDDRRAGGHVLEMQLSQAVVARKPSDRLEIALPDTWPQAAEPGRSSHNEKPLSPSQPGGMAVEEP